MAHVEEGLVSWLSGCSSSLQISIASALFIIIYVTVYSLCTSCFSISDSVSPRHLHRREKTNIPSVPQQNKLPESQHVEHTPEVKDLSVHIYSLVEAQTNEENPYECISEPPLQPPSDKAEGENESPSPAMTKPDDNHTISTLIKPVNKQPVEQTDALPQHLTGSEPTAVYAAVNWKTKSQKSIAPLFDTDTVLEMSNIAKESVPPIPDKHF